ncbi:MAG: lamin tail domain-containing protein [Candidatus Wallacebacter cryptica]
MKHVKLMLAALIMVLVLGTAGLAFTDPLLELAVKLELARINAGDDLKQITTLDLRELGVSSLAGIEQLNNLESLDLRGNPIRDLTPIQSLTKLKSLNLRETLVTDLSSLKNLTNLQYLNLHSTPAVDLSVIANLKNLETLIMRNVMVGDQIEVIAGLTNLRRLNIRNTGVSDLTVIGSLMEQGALQNLKGLGIDAEVDIRDNPLFADPRSDDYAPVRPYWQNIAVREPLSLPEITAQLVYINEVMSSNGGVIRDRYGDSPDWIELYNPHERDVDLSGFYLSDSDNQVDKWRIPDGTVIKAGTYLLIFASSKDTVINGELHTNFNISAAGEPIILSDAELRLVDFLPAVEIPRNISFGRVPDGGMDMRFMTIPTPGVENTERGSYQ